MTTDAAPATQEEIDAAAASHEADQEAADALEKAKEQEKLDLPDIEGYRGFVAPVERNTRFLAVRGEVVQLRDQNSATGKRDTQRQGDKWVEFHNGSFTTSDPDLIKWCEEHPNICRDSADPKTSLWFQIRFAQTKTSRRNPSLGAEANIDAFLDGETDKLGAEDPAVATNRKYTEQANERAAEPV